MPYLALRNVLNLPYLNKQVVEIDDVPFSDSMNVDLLDLLHER